MQAARLHALTGRSHSQRTTPLGAENPHSHTDVWSVESRRSPPLVCRAPTPLLTPSADEKSSLEALHAALDQLENMTESILSAYQASLAAGDFDRPEDEAFDFESVNDRLWAEKEARGGQSREEWEREKREKEEAEVKVKEEGKKGKKVAKK